MAGLGWRRFTREKLASADVQGYLMDQSVMVFDSASQRDAILVTPTDGMVCYLEDTDSYWSREAGALWRPLDGQWPQQDEGDPLPTSGVRSGDRVYSVPYGCMLIYDAAPSGWRQATDARSADTVDDYVTAATARGVTGWHLGFRYVDETRRRVYVCRGSGDFALVTGDALAPVISGFPVQSGWTYVGGGTTWVRSLGNGMAQLYVVVTKATAALTVGVTGDTANTTIGKLPPGYEPLAAATLTSGGNGRGAFGYIGTNGDIILTGTTPGGNIAVGEEISLGGTYRLADLGL